MMFVMIDLCLLVICLYLRFGLRKVLKIEFPMEVGSETTQSTQTQTSPSNRRSSLSQIRALSPEFSLNGATFLITQFIRELQELC